MTTSSERPDTPPGQRPTVATACGKLILLGEHAVVYGEPALAVPLVDLRLSVVLATTGDPFSGVEPRSPRPPEQEPSLEELSLDDLKETAAFPTYKVPLDADDSEDEDGADGWPRLAESRTLALGDAPPLQIDVGEDAPPDAESSISRALALAAKTLELPVPLPLRVAVRSGGLCSGMGTSAALGVALARALLSFYGRRAEPALVLRGAAAVEELFHGTPSGVDHTVVAGECPVWFLKGKAPQQLRGMPALDLVIRPGISPQATSEVVEAVRQRLVSEPLLARVIAAIGRWTRDGRAAWSAGDFQALAEAMTAQQAELDRLGVVVDSDREGIDRALVAGALAAKITGAGCGGTLFALVQEESAGRVLEAWGPGALRARVGKD